MKSSLGRLLLFWLPLFALFVEARPHFCLKSRQVTGNSSTIEQVGNCDELATNSSVSNASGNTTLSYPQIYHIPGTHPPLILQPIGIGDPIFIATYILFSHRIQQDLIDQIGKHDHVLDYDGFTKQERGLIFRATPLRGRHFEIRLSTAANALQGLGHVLAFGGYHELRCKIHVDVYRPEGGDGEFSIVHANDEGFDISADSKPSDVSSTTKIAARDANQYPPIFRVPGTEPPLVLRPTYVHTVILRLPFILGSEVVRERLQEYIQYQGDPIIDRHGASFTSYQLNFQFRRLASQHFIVRYSTFAAALTGVGEMMQRYGYKELVCKVHLGQYIVGGGDAMIEVIKIGNEVNDTVVAEGSRIDASNLTKRSPDDIAMDSILSKEIFESRNASSLSSGPRYPQTYTVPGSFGPLILAPRLPAGDPITSRLLIMGVQRIRNKVRLLIERYGDQIISSQGLTWPYAQDFAIHVQPLPTQRREIRYSTVLSAIQGMDNLLSRYGRFELTATIHIALFRPSGGDGEIRFFKPTLDDEPVDSETAAISRRNGGDFILNYPHMYQIPHSQGPIFLDSFHSGRVIHRDAFQYGMLMIERDVHNRLAQHGNQIIPWDGFIWRMYGLVFMVTPLESERYSMKTSTILDVLRGVRIMLESYGWVELTANIHIQTYRPLSGDGRIRLFLRYDIFSGGGEDINRLSD